MTTTFILDAAGNLFLPAAILKHASLNAGDQVEVTAQKDRLSIVAGSRAQSDLPRRTTSFAKTGRPQGLRGG
ncbi:MAG: AbrB/MazE/SpoVT family DNA-binding domain-containing protein [Verrucomicrobiaceae bacterium]|nr:AbrB/MazE/SpoVT family DNA-binding domain-containing protein [Verrucomicrobiaceae bacterium]